MAAVVNAIATAVVNSIVVDGQSQRTLLLLTNLRSHPKSHPTARTAAFVLIAWAYVSDQKRANGRQLHVPVNCTV
jgi:hypothetical protein